MTRSPADIDFMTQVVNNPAIFSLAFFRQKGYWEEGTTALPDFIEQAYKLVEERNPKTAIILPRNHAKSTSFSKIYPLWVALTEPSYIRIFSATDAQSQKIAALHDRILRTHKQINHYFGNQTENSDMWNAHRKVLKNGSVIEYSSVGSETRGVVSNLGRPSLIILDDIETLEQAKNEQLTDKVVEWLLKDLLPSLSTDGRVILLGTVISKLSLTHKIAVGDFIGWSTFVRKAVDFDTQQVLWNGHPDFGRYDFWTTKRAEYAAIGRLADFHSEYLNEPLENATAPFASFSLKTFTDLPDRNLRWFSAIDLAYSKKKNSDYTAYIVGATDSDNNLYIVEADQARLDPTERIDLCFRLISQYRHKGLFAIYIEGHSDFLTHTLPAEQQRRGFQFGVIPLKHNGVSKYDRIISLQPYLGNIYFGPGGAKLMTELQTYTRHAKHDDLVDTLAYLRREAIPAGTDKAAPQHTILNPATQRLLDTLKPKSRQPDFGIAKKLWA